MKITVLSGLLIFMMVFGFVGCDNGNGTTDEFVSSINETISNDLSTLGLIGTNVVSSNVNVATVEIADAKIKITSVGEGLSVITISNDLLQSATINITVSKNGSIVVNSINKYSYEEDETIGIQVYNSNGTVFTGNDSGIYWFSKVLIDTDLGNHQSVGTVTITNGKLIDFDLPETIADQYLDGEVSYGDASARGGNLIIKLQSGKMLRLYLENSWGIYFYSNTAASGATVGGISGSMALNAGWNCVSIVNGNPLTISTVENLDEYKWTRIDP